MLTQQLSSKYWRPPNGVCFSRTSLSISGEDVLSIEWRHLLSMGVSTIDNSIGGVSGSVGSYPVVSYPQNHVYRFPGGGVWSGVVRYRLLLSTCWALSTLLECYVLHTLSRGWEPAGQHSTLLDSFPLL